MEDNPAELKWKKDIVDRAQLICALLNALNMPVDFITSAALRLTAFQLDLGREKIGPIEDLTLRQIHDRIDQVATEIKNQSMQELDFILADRMR